MAARKISAARRPKSPRRGTPRKRWSQEVTGHSDALDLERSVFTLKDPRRIALSLKRSAEASKRRKSEPYRSAMSMLVFYINRAGKGLPKRQAAVLEKAKDELRKVFGRA
ncbi:MAG: DUF3175 domain-containing protein [Rhodospirillaceae bacterium]|nr:DUF3175 domain-containing protein [Rhodospirillaceae bacterium]